MNRLFKLQFLGPCVLFAATLCAEIAAQALQYSPSSELLWFINLRIFSIFQRSHALLSGYVSIDAFQLFGVALPLFVLACLGLAARARLAFTVATHLSAGYAGFLVYAWQAGVPTAAQATLGSIAIPPGAGLYVMATILGACLLSFAITHLLYFRDVGKEIAEAAGRLGMSALCPRRCGL
ncbi:hypothetical protein J2R76_002521 [Bradyrhizobium sp. USDA 4532]|uniref:hypothetical protein n=1 Tax=unclassified Bradyrhizobium TaxID=2631580 RepID=UPI00209D528F|nr:MULTISPECIES: hypothetical protein [unclassified Bradyrhizobium]MCP1834184.1 hypothetical protein [Bradyrhizobium sp. USDA 4545]MCP1918930.1 hypothetical protein [Bradyrhizobium sp. USDA 4532]